MIVFSVVYDSFQYMVYKIFISMITVENVCFGMFKVYILYSVNYFVLYSHKNIYNNNGI